MQFHPFRVHSLRAGPAVVVLFAVALLLGCGGPGDHTPRLPTADPASADVVLWVSNQSFSDETVRITVRIDGRTVIDQDFDVEGQHNWIKFPLGAGPGAHELAVTSDTGARLVDQLVVPETGLRYGVVNYWRDEEQPDRRFFDFETSDRPFGFA
jgi:hypothetical protein